MNVGLVALVYYIAVVVGVSRNVIVLYEFVVFVVVVVKWWWWWRTGDCDSCCMGGNFDTCRIAILKCILGEGVSGDFGGGGLVLVVVVVVLIGFWWWW